MISIQENTLEQEKVRRGSYNIMLYVFIITSLLGAISFDIHSEDTRKDLDAIEQSIKNEARRALNDFAHENGITPEQVERVIKLVEQEKDIVRRYIGEKNGIFGKVNHNPKFPLDLMKKVAQRNNIDIGNMLLLVGNTTYFNNVTGDAGAYGIGGTTLDRIPIEASSEPFTAYVDKRGNLKFMNNVYRDQITIYPEANKLSLQEQEALLIHELEHVIQRHASFRWYLYSLAQQNTKKPKIDLFKSKRSVAWVAGEEKEANILPAIRDAEVADLLVSVCDKKDRKILSQDDCRLLRQIKALHDMKK